MFPFKALNTFINQLKVNGLLFIGAYAKAHGVQDAGEMDPFGVLPEFMPYVLSEYFGHKVSLDIKKLLNQILELMFGYLLLKEIFNIFIKIRLLFFVIFLKTIFN